MAFFLLLQPTAADRAVVLSDRTERGGPTVAYAEEATGTDGRPALRFRGELGSIAGENGPVGFALVRSAFAESPTAETRAEAEGVELRLNGSRADGLAYAILLRTLDSAASPYQGQLTYQRAFMNDGRNAVRARWSEFRPYVRGRELAPEQAPAFDPKRAVDWAVQIAQSAQDPAKRAASPLPFVIELARP